jgi:recombinational DNA repair protein RecR
MDIIPNEINKLTGFFKNLPGIGSRQSSRLAFFITHYSVKNLKEVAKLI